MREYTNPCNKNSDQMVAIFIGWDVSTAIEPHILDKLYQVLLHYDAYTARLAALRHKLDGLVKPDSVTRFLYI